MNTPKEPTIADTAKSILPKYFELVVELLGSFSFLLSKASRNIDNFTTPLLPAQDSGSTRSQLLILEELFSLDVDLKDLVERLVRHKQIYGCLKEFKHHEFDQCSTVSEFYAGINELRMKLIDALHFAKSLTQHVDDNGPTSVNTKDLVVYASRLSKITSAVEGPKSLEAPLPQEYHARASILFTGFNPCSDETQHLKSQIIEETTNTHPHHHQDYFEYSMGKEVSSEHSEEDRDKWLNLEL